ncbi:acyl carrier protein [Paenibacillus sp. N3.4]|uniref:acyl carrier protein n=1 Tax=Paenibacillus sp. N3.4 TaxID=2603222 RepID=UPI00164FF249|nr:acyl carrier protein [Paenibacillus sp. N3.4]
MNVKQQIQAAINEIAIGVEEDELTDEMMLRDLGIDSLKYVELLVRIEELCEIVFDESDLGMESLRSVGDLAALTNKTIAKRAG